MIIIKKELETLFSNTITYKYSFNGVNISSYEDDYFNIEDELELSKVIYNGIIDYSYKNNDTKVYDYNNLYRALKTRLKFDVSNEENQKKHGFYGEIILYLLLISQYEAGRIVSKGFFYSILDNGEAKGFDAFHFYENDANLQLWYGESKFRKGYRQSVNEILSKINDSFSEKYLERNLLAIFEKFDYWDDEPSKLTNLRKKWIFDTQIDLYKDCIDDDIEIVYPCLIMYQQKKTIDERSMIEEVVSHINDYCKKNSVNVNAELNISIFFVFIPILDVAQVKGRVIQWIRNQEPLI